MTAVALARLLVPDVRGLPRAFWLLFAAALVDRLGGFAVTFLTIYLTRDGAFSVGVAGIVISLLAFGGVLGAPVGGALADRIGRKPVLVGGMLLTALSWVHVAFAVGTVHIGVAVLLAGIASALARPAMSAAIADVVPEEHRQRAFGFHYWAINLGFGVAAFTGGMLVGVVPWRAVFFADAVTSVIAALLLLLAMKEARPVAGTVVEPARLSDMLAGPLRDRVFMTLIAMGLVNAAMFQQGFVALAAELTADGLGAGQYGKLIAINGVLIVLLQPSLTQVATRLRSTSVLGFACFLVGTGFFLTAFCDAWYEHACAIAVWTLGEILLAATMPAVITQLSPVESRATYQGFYSLSWSAAAFAPMLGAQVLEHAGSLALWTLCLAGGLWGVLVQVRLSKEPRMHEGHALDVAAGPHGGVPGREGGGGSGGRVAVGGARAGREAGAGREARDVREVHE